jgi:hypothetical protein
MASAFNGASQLTLMPSACTRLAARTYLSAVGYVTSQQVSLFVINFHAMVSAKLAYTRLGEIAFSTTRHF